MPLEQVEGQFFNLEEQIKVLVNLPEDVEADVSRNPLSKSSNSSSSSLALKAKRLGKPNLRHSTSRSSLNEEDVLGGRLREMIAHHKATAEKDRNAGSSPPSPQSSSSKSSISMIM